MTTKLSKFNCSQCTKRSRFDIFLVCDDGLHKIHFCSEKCKYTWHDQETRMDHVFPYDFAPHYFIDDPLAWFDHTHTTERR